MTFVVLYFRRGRRFCVASVPRAGAPEECDMKPLTDLSDDALASLARRAEHELPDAPQWLVASVLAMWHAPAPAPTLGQRLAAVIAFDSWVAQPALALRSALPATRQLLFTAQGRDVDLRVSPADPASRPPTRFAIAGQVLGPGANGAVSLSRAGATVCSAVLDEFGEFRFADVAVGAYVITVRFGDDEIVLPEIDVGAEPQA